MMKVYLVYLDYHSEASDNPVLQVCATEEAANRWIATISDERDRKDCYIEDMEVFE